MMDTKARLLREREQEYLRQPHMPDFDAVRDKRMSELTPEQQRDAHELWLRDQMDHMAPYYQEHLLFLLERLDEARLEAVRAPWDETDHLLSSPSNAERLRESIGRFRVAGQVPDGWKLVPATASDKWASDLMQKHPIRHDAALKGIRDVLATAPKYREQT